MSLENGHGRNWLGIVISFLLVFPHYTLCNLYILYIYYIYIHRYVFHPSQGSSVWLGLMSREQLMPPECSKYKVLSFAKILNMYIYIYIYILAQQSASFTVSKCISKDVLKSLTCPKFIVSKTFIKYNLKSVYYN